jgi:NTE family protein
LVAQAEEAPVIVVTTPEADGELEQALIDAGIIVIRAAATAEKRAEMQKKADALMLKHWHVRNGNLFFDGLALAQICAQRAVYESLRPGFSHPRASFDSLDSVAFPRRGSASAFEWRGQVADRTFQRVSDSLAADWRIARSWGKNTAIIWTSAGTLLDAEEADGRSYFPVGGFLNLSGMSAESLNGPHFGSARLIYYRKIGNGGEGLLNVPMYAGMSIEVGNTWERRSQMTLGSARKDMSLFFGLDTFLGPAWLAAGYDSEGRKALYLSLGHSF